MLRNRGICRFAVIFSLLALGPALALAEPPKAGVVTALQGQAILARGALPEPISLKFMDDLFLKDRIDTREHSVVRVLLGGKALVTVRELSTLTVTEEPGRAVVDLRVGKLALGLAKHLLKPGEVIEVRTPNAIAAVRGSLVVVEVKLIGGVPHTDVFVLEASRPVTVSSRTNPAVTIPLLPHEAVSASGAGAATTLGPVEKMTPAQVREIQTTAEAPKPKAHSEKPPERVTAKISSQQLQEASQLAAQLGPGASATSPPPGKPDKAKPAPSAPGLTPSAPLGPGGLSAPGAHPLAPVLRPAAVSRPVALRGLSGFSAPGAHPLAPVLRPAAVSRPVALRGLSGFSAPGAHPLAPVLRPAAVSRPVALRGLSGFSAPGAHPLAPVLRPAAVSRPVALRGLSRVSAPRLLGPRPGTGLSAPGLNATSATRGVQRLRQR